ncbi:hypothetical protein [Alienimonas sp. DA493]|uniref:type II and III secretion system protein family protein n=1 Tax=Alienimonas sp. DA493 TaxID=3373605 RepID=UPI003753EDD5
MPVVRTARPIAPGCAESGSAVPRALRRSARWRRFLGAGALLAVPALGWAQDGGGPPAPAAEAIGEATPGLATAEPAEAPAGAATESVVRLSGPRTKTEIVKTYAKRILLPPGMKWTDAGGFDENVVTVTAEDNASLRLYAASPGVTQVDLLAVDEDGNQRTFSIEVLVTADARALQAAVDRLFPGTAVEVYGLTDTSVVLRGWITRPEQVSQIVEVAGQYFPPENILNQMRVAAPQQVQLNVVFMEVQRSKAQEMGINLSWFGEDGFFSSTVGDVVPLSGIGGVGSGNTGLPLGGTPSLQFPAAAISNPTLAAGVISSSGVFQAFVRALREERLLKVLSEPVQVASNGRPSYFQAGGEFPVPIPQGLGAVGIEYRPYGVELSAVPIILGGGRVRLELAASVSDLDFSRGTTISGTTVPGLSQRQTNTQVELEFGKTLMIAGLIQNTQQAAAQKIPLLGELPGIGAAFRRVKFEEAETELVILVTPHPVAGLDPHEVPCGGPGRSSAAPTTRELFGLGVLEVPGADPCGPGSTPGCGPTCGPVCNAGGIAGAPGGFVGAGYPAASLPPQTFAPHSDGQPVPAGAPTGFPPPIEHAPTGDFVPAAPMPIDGGRSLPNASPAPAGSPNLSMPPRTPSRSVPGGAQPPALPIEPAPAPVPTEDAPAAAPDAGADAAPAREANRFAPSFAPARHRSATAPTPQVHRAVGGYQPVSGQRAGAPRVVPAAYQHAFPQAAPAVAPPATADETADGSRPDFGSFGTGRVTAPPPIRR